MRTSPLERAVRVCSALQRRALRLEPQHLTSAVPTRAGTSRPTRSAFAEVASHEATPEVRARSSEHARDASRFTASGPAPTHACSADTCALRSQGCPRSTWRSTAAPRSPAPRSPAPSSLVPSTQASRALAPRSSAPPSPALCSPAPGSSSGRVRVHAAHARSAHARAAHARAAHARLAHARSAHARSAHARFLEPRSHGSRWSGRSLSWRGRRAREASETV